MKDYILHLHLVVFPIKLNVIKIAFKRTKIEIATPWKNCNFTLQLFLLVCIVSCFTLVIILVTTIASDTQNTSYSYSDVLLQKKMLCLAAIFIGFIFLSFSN